MEELYDNEILELAMENTYDLLMGCTTVEKLLDSGKDFMPFICDPSNVTQDDLQNLLQYFEREENYEKCYKILELINKDDRDSNI